LHQSGYVFGDLREPNILYREGKVYLIDFNWCGRHNLEGVESSANVRYQLMMSEVDGMWADGMKAGELIKPCHDFTMLDKLNL